MRLVAIVLNLIGLAFLAVAWKAVDAIYLMAFATFHIRELLHINTREPHVKQEHFRRKLRR
jgi:hypothetical protein